MTYFFETYGCQMNSAESAALDLVLRERGWTPAGDGEGADLVLLNTCSVRQTAENRVFGRLAHYTAQKKRRHSPRVLIVAGCMARLGEALKQRFPAVDYVMGAAVRSRFPLILQAVEEGRTADTGFPGVDEEPVFSFSALHHEAGRFRALVPIMHGCNNYCSYCIVPVARGPEVSREPAAILAEIRLLAERGVREITLLGQNVNSYRRDGETFPALLERIAGAVEGTPIRWIRFLSANPKDFSSQTVQVLAAYPVFCRHLHLCVQHGSNRVLEAMNRRYTRERYLELVSEIREALPGITLSTDILIGFPGETGDDVEATLSLMEAVKFLYAYMYHYNPREGTAAFSLPDRVGEEVKRERLARVIALQKRHTQELLRRRIGSRELVLVEGISRRNAGELITRTERDEMAVVPGSPARIGSFAELTLASLRGNTFRACRLDPLD